MKKRMTIMLIGLGIVFGGIIGFNLIKSLMMALYFAHYVPPAVTVSSVTAIKKNWKPVLPTIGNFVAINGVDVNAQTGGNVVAIHFDSGQSIEKGSPLIDIDDAVEQATLKFNQADLSLQETNYKRQTDLLTRNATATSSVDAARARLLQAQANMEKTQALINQKHILAPFSGQLGIRQINLGQYIQPGQTGIVALQSLDPIHLQFYLPEHLLPHLYLNQPILFYVEQNKNYFFKGRISAINSKIDANTHTIEVEASLPNCPATAFQRKTPSNLITIQKQAGNKAMIVTCDTDLNTKNKITQFNFIPGMFASIDIEQPVKNDVIVIPTTAISYTLYGNSVFIIESSKTKKDENDKPLLTVKQIFVMTGETQGNDTVIKRGLLPGQQVVASGDLKLQDGTRVLINNSVQLQASKNLDTLSP